MQFFRFHFYRNLLIWCLMFHRIQLISRLLHPKHDMSLCHIIMAISCACPLPDSLWSMTPIYLGQPTSHSHSFTQGHKNMNTLIDNRPINYSWLGTEIADTIDSDRRCLFLSTRYLKVFNGSNSIKHWTLGNNSRVNLKSCCCNCYCITDLHSGP